MFLKKERVLAIHFLPDAWVGKTLDFTLLLLFISIKEQLMSVMGILAIPKVVDMIFKYKGSL